MTMIDYLRPANWKLSQRLVLMGLATALGTTSLLGILSIRASQKAILAQQENALAANCTARTNQAEQYFAIIREQMFNFAQNRMITEATDEFSKAFQTTAEELAWETDPASSAYQSCASYFGQQFQPRLLEAGLEYRGADTYTPVDPNGIALQAMYIGNNPNPVGEKLQLDRSSEDCTYNNLHETYHPRVRDFLNSFGFYDIFLFDTEGNMVYSVFKETDYATNFINGPYADTNFGEVYRDAVKASSPGYIAIKDFKYYEPSYGAPASFIGSPVFRDGKKVGVAIFQMPVDKINDLMADTAGLGETGESYFIGHDQKMRSQSRFEEDNTILAVTVDSAAVQAGIKGESGHLEQDNRRGEHAIAAYSPVDIEGLDWIVVAETTTNEVLAPARALRTQIIVLAVILAAVSGLISIFFARSLVKPILGILGVTETLASGDLTARLDESRKDELGRLSVAVNTMTTKLSTLISGIQQSTQQVSSASAEIAASSEELATGADQQTAQISQVSAAIEEMSTSIIEVARKSSEAATQAEQAGNDAGDGGEIVQNTVTEIDAIAQQVADTAQAVASLGEKSQEIGQIIDVINDIADQTNLLALNAAIEAARAGEHGRGFAVVADEVRKLAERTTKATEEVGTSIGEIQDETKKAVERMDGARDQVTKGVELANEAGSSLERIVNGSTKVAGEINDIAAAAEEQSATAEEISQTIESVASVVRQSSEGASQAATAAAQMSGNAEELQGMIAQFKVS